MLALKNVPEVIAAETSEFWGSMKKLQTSLWIPIIIGFMNYWMIYADEPISTKSAL